MFVTLEDFYNNYLIKNQQQPNETVLNRGLMRLKRETRELKSILDVLLGLDIAEWYNTRIYEKDEYVRYNGLLYKSRIYTNYSQTPYRDDTEFWELITLESLGTEGKGKFQSREFIATEGQTIFEVPFNMDGTPMVYIEGILIDSSKYSKISNVAIKLNTGANNGETVIVSSGVTYDTSLVLSKQVFISEQLQTVFECDFVLKSPYVFVGGVLMNDSSYTWVNKTLTFEIGIDLGETVIVGNGGIIGQDMYNKDDVDTLLDEKANIIDFYSKSEIDTELGNKLNILDFNDVVDSINANKANWSTSLEEYGIVDAFTKNEVSDLLSLKLNSEAFTSSNILNMIKQSDGAGSGLDADYLDGLDSTEFLRINEANEKRFNLDIVTLEDIYASTKVFKNRIIMDVESTDPAIYIRKYNTNQSYEQSTVYTSGNTSNVMIIREGYFKGLWEPTLDSTFGINDYYNYNWTVSVTPTLIGYEHDFNLDYDNGHTPYPGFDYNFSWDSNQSEYHFGYISENIVKLQSIHKNDTITIDIPARYHLIGVLKTFSSYLQVNQ